MARKRTSPAALAAAAAAVAAVESANEDAASSDDVLDMEAASVASDVLEGLRKLRGMDAGGKAITWYVYSNTPGKTGESEGYIEKLRTDQLDEARFKHKYGPGEYRVFGKNAAGEYIRGSHCTIKISDILSAEVTAAAPSGQPDMLALLRELRAQDEARAAKRTEDWKAYAAILAAPLATLGAAIIGRKSLDIPALIAALRPQQSSLTELTTALASLRQMSGDGQPNSIDVFFKMLDKVQDLPTGGDTSWLSVLRDAVREFGPPVREALAGLQQQQQQLAAPQVALQRPSGNGSIPNGSPSVPSPGLPSAPGLPTPTPTHSAPPGPSTTEDNMLAMIKPWLQRKAEELHESASTNMDTELCAEHLLMQVDKKFGDLAQPAQLLEWLSRPDWWEQFVAFYPPIAHYQGWIAELRGELLQMLQEETSPPAASPASPELQ